MYTDIPLFVGSCMVTAATALPRLRAFLQTNPTNWEGLSTLSPSPEECGQWALDAVHRNIPQLLEWAIPRCTLTGVSGALNRACRKGSLDSVECVLATAALPHKIPLRKPLELAAQNRHHAIVSALLAHATHHGTPSPKGGWSHRAIAVRAAVTANDVEGVSRYFPTLQNNHATALYKLAASCDSVECLMYFDKCATNDNRIAPAIAETGGTLRPNALVYLLQKPIEAAVKKQALLQAVETALNALPTHGRAQRYFNVVFAHLSLKDVVDNLSSATPPNRVDHLVHLHNVHINGVLTKEVANANAAAPKTPRQR